MSDLTGQEIWLEDEVGMIVGEITGIRADGAYLVLTGEITTDMPERFTARIPIYPPARGSAGSSPSDAARPSPRRTGAAQIAP